MRTLGGFCFTLVLASGLSAQYRGSVTPSVTGGFGSVVFPGGTSATTPGVTRSFGSVVSPGGGGPHLTVPGGAVPGYGWPGNGHNTHRTAPATTYLYPVFVSGYGGYGGYYEGYSGEQGAPQQQQPNITVVMPPQPVTPVIINVGPGGGQYTTTTEGQQGVYEAPSRPAVEESVPAADEPLHYLIAFKDHTIYSAVAYWVDGDTLHYFTSGNTHNQASISLLDRPLTERLNKEFGVEFKIPAAK
jgi:hypothetical protein